MKTSDRIIQYISEHGSVSAKELSDYLDTLTPRAIRKQLKTLFDNNILEKTGKPPKVFYSIKSTKSKKTTNIVDPNILSIIEHTYLHIGPDGIMRSGWNGFETWCEKTGQDPVKTAREYARTLAKYETFKKDELIDGMQKMRETFETVFLDHIFYLDFYSIERFGKTKLGQILLHAKSSQNRNLIKALAKEIRPSIENMINTYKIDGIGFIPPTVKREVQLMKALEQYLAFPVKTVQIEKIKTPISIPQKTLSKLPDRVENAQKTIVVTDPGRYENILLIDDAVGSGATMNETARQIRKRKMCSGKIVGLAITGSFKGFDVISEV